MRFRVQRVGRKQEGCRGGDLVGLGNAAEQMGRTETGIGGFEIGKSAQQARRRHGAWGEAIDADLLGGVIHGHRLGEVDQPSLGGAIGDRAGGGDAAELRADEDDRTAAAFRDQRYGELAHQERACQADIDLVPPCAFVEIDDGGAG